MGRQTKKNRKNKKTKKPVKAPRKTRTRRSDRVRAQDAALVKDIKALRQIVNNARNKSLTDQDFTTMMAAIETLGFVTDELSKKCVALDRLQKILFGDTSEKTKAVMAKLEDDTTPAESDGDEPDGEEGESGSKKKKKRPGHGRRPASEYTGAEKIPVQHETLSVGDSCPSCEIGKLYALEPSTILRVTGVGPVAATMHELERLRCSSCTDVFKATTPSDIGKNKYHVSVMVMLALLRYGYGMPFTRIEKLCGNMGIPLPWGTQWDLVNKGSTAFEKVADALAQEAAQGDVVHIDDTKMRVLDLHAELVKALKEAKKAGVKKSDEPRTGVRTTGLLSTLNVGSKRQVVLFFTGHQHAGENFADLMKHRDTERAAPIQMCDALAANSSHEFEVILANCLTHARRNFVNVIHNFPDEVVHILLALKTIYINDSATREMTPTARLEYHQERSKPVMDDLATWMAATTAKGSEIEPNSSLGRAINYMNKHWEALTRFLVTPGAPLDNNAAERALKAAIRHRRNSLFYKTERGARVGDVFMSLIYTAQLDGKNAWDYLLAIAKHPKLANDQPRNWLPWTYQDTLKSLAASA